MEPLLHGAYKGFKMDTVTKNMKRSEIRYALYRCKNNCASEEHMNIFSFYKDQLAPYGFDIEDFAILGGWDISKIDTTQIVTGKTVMKYIDELLAPLV